MRESVSITVFPILTAISGFGQAAWPEVFQNPESGFNAKKPCTEPKTVTKKQSGEAL
jgi:hypothetical protein